MCMCVCSRCLFVCMCGHPSVMPAIHQQCSLLFWGIYRRAKTTTKKNNTKHMKQHCNKQTKHEKEVWHSLHECKVLQKKTASVAVASTQTQDKDINNRHSICYHPFAILYRTNQSQTVKAKGGKKKPQTQGEMLMLWATRM